MFSNKIDTYNPVKDDKLRASSNSNFDFDGEGFSSMLEKDETLSGKLRETEAEIREDESILSTDEENQAIAKRNSQKRAEAINQTQNNINTSKPETDARNLLKLMDMSTKVNMSAINITKSKKELENTTGASILEADELSGIVTKMLEIKPTIKEQNQIETTIDLSTSEEKMSDSEKEEKNDVLHETQEELLEDMSILSTDEENLAMVNKAKEYKALTDSDFSKNGEEDMEFINELISIQNQSMIEVNHSHKVKNAESIMAQIIEESKNKTVKLNASELSSEDVDYIINLLQQGTADSAYDDKENPSALSAKFLAMLKDSMINKKVFRIDFDNEISVIIKIDVEGKISANFLTSSKELEEGLRNNLYILRQKFEEQGIKYGSIEYTSMEKDNTQIDIQEVIKTIQAAESNSTLEERKNNEKTIH